MAQAGRGGHGPDKLIRPMFAVPDTVPSGPEWSYEFKWDGVRAIVYRTEPGRLRMFSRNDNDITVSYPELAILDDLLGDHRAILDGEIVALDPRGRPLFGLLQHRMHNKQPDQAIVARIPVSFYAFDLLHLDGRDLLDDSYERRRELLDQLRLDGGSSQVRVSPHFQDVDGTAMLDIARQHGLEGIVAKRIRSRYEPGRRSRAWIKTALLNTQEVVVGGWQTGEGRRAGTVGSLLLGAYDRDDRLVYLGKVGTGFTDSMLRDTRERLRPLQRPDSPFDSPVPREDARFALWVEPRLVGEVEYRTLSVDGRLRHASWRGLRSDKASHDVRAPFFD